MVSVQKLVNELSTTELETLLLSPSIKQAFVQEMVEEYGVEKEELNNILKQLYEKQYGGGVVDTKPKFTVVKKKPMWNLGGSFKTQQMKAEIMNLILEDLENQGGKSKTQLLRSFNKDNITWRTITSEVLDYLVGKNLIVRVTNKYYLNKNQSFRESKIHRTIYSLLCEGPHTTSSLLRGIGYNNPKGKIKLLQALKIMEQELLVTKQGKHWGLIV